MKKNIAQAGLEINPSTYVFSTIVFALLVSASAGSIMLMQGSDAARCAAVLVAVFGVVFYALYNAPLLLAKKKARELEAELPNWLRTMGVCLSTGIPFEDSLYNAIGSEGMLSRALGKACNSIKHGSSVEKALKQASAEFDSRIFQRATAQVVFVYETGASPEVLVKMADDVAALERSRARERASKFSLLGLAFITSSCVLPALFLLYTILGASFLENDFSPQTLWLVYALAFPGLNLLVLAAVFAVGFQPSKSQYPGFYSPLEKTLFENALREKGMKVNFHAVFPFAVAACSMVSLAGAAALGLQPPWLYASALVFLIPFIFYFLVLSIAEQRTNAIEASLPDALFQAASFQHGQSMEKTLKFIAESEYGPLSGEFEMASNQVQAGLSVPKAMEQMASRNSSQIIKRVCELLSLNYRMGHNLRKALHSTAEDLSTLFAQAREQEAAMALQKYTVLVGGGLVVPLILGWAMSFAYGINTQTAAAQETKALLETAQTAIPVYLVEFSLLSSLFIAAQQGSKARAIIYFLVLAPVALAVFELASKNSF